MEAGTKLNSRGAYLAEEIRHAQTVRAKTGEYSAERLLMNQRLADLAVQLVEELEKERRP